MTKEKSPSILNTAWQRMCGNASGFPALPLHLGCKPQTVQCMIATTLAGCPAKRQEELTDFMEETECCWQTNMSQWKHQVDRTFRQQRRESQKPSKTVGASWLAQQTWNQASPSRQMGSLKLCTEENCTGGDQESGK